MVNESPVICAGAIVEVVLARKTDEHALIVGERDGKRSRRRDETLSQARLINNAGSTNGKGRTNPTGYGKGRSAGTEHDRINLGRLRWRDVSALRGGKGRRVGGPIRHGHRRPVRRVIPVAADWIKVPGSAAGEDGIQRAERKRWNDGAGQNARFHVGNYAYGPL